jgi:hypothetical protein
MQHSIGRFILFLGMEFLFMLASAASILPIGLSVQRHQTLKNSLAFWLVLSLVVVSNAFLFLFVWVLTGENYLSVFGLLLVLTLALMLLVELLWLLIGSGSVPWFARVVWAGYEFQQRARVFNKMIQGLGSIVILVVFPLYIGLGFFRHAMANEDWVRYVFRATLILLFAAPQVMTLPQGIFALTSKNVLGDTRARIFIGQLSGAISLLVLASLFIWSVGGAGQASPLLGKNFIFSPSVLYATLIYVTAVIFIPYLVGHYRAKDWNTHLEAERSDIVEELSKGLRSPNWTRVDKTLVDADQIIEDEINKMESSESVRLAHEIEESDKPTDLIYKVASREGLDCDPRFLHIKVLRGIRDQVNECRMLLGTENEEKRKREIANEYIAILSGLNQHRERTAVRPWVLAAATTVFLAAVNPVLTSAGKFVASQLGISK